MRRPLLTTLLCLLLLPACAFHMEAHEWNGRVGPDGNPVYFMSTTKVGMKLFVVIPLFGNLSIDGMVDELTEEVAELGGDHITIVQGDTENYWYGLSPLTWIFTPVVSTLAATYRPTPERFAADLAERCVEECGDVCPEDCLCPGPCQEREVAVPLAP